LWVAFSAEQATAGNIILFLAMAFDPMRKTGRQANTEAYKEALTILNEADMSESDESHRSFLLATIAWSGEIINLFCQGDDRHLHTIVKLYELKLEVGGKDATVDARNPMALKRELVKALKQNMLEASEVDVDKLFKDEDWAPEQGCFVPWLTTQGGPKLKMAVKRQQYDNYLDFLGKSPERGSGTTPQTAPSVSAMLAGSSAKLQASLAATSSPTAVSPAKQLSGMDTLMVQVERQVTAQLERQWAAQQEVNASLQQTMALLSRQMQDMAPITTTPKKKKTIVIVSSSDSEADEDVQSYHSGSNPGGGGTKLDTLLGRDLNSREMEQLVAALDRQFGVAGARAFVTSKAGQKGPVELRRLAGHFEGVRGVYAALQNNDEVEAKRLTGLLLKKMSLYITALLDLANGGRSAMSNLQLLDLEGENRLEETLQMAKLSKTLQLDKSDKKKHFSGAGGGRGGGSASKPMGSFKGSDAAASGSKQ
jgi:hypothetical protein